MAALSDDPDLIGTKPEYVPSWLPPFPKAFTYMATQGQLQPNLSMPESRKRSLEMRNQEEAALGRIATAEVEADGVANAGTERHPLDTVLDRIERVYGSAPVQVSSDTTQNEETGGAIAGASGQIRPIFRPYPKTVPSSR